jgi:transcriptional regulator
MYIPKHFLVEDQKTIFEFLRNNSFGILFSNHKGSSFATHLPFLLNKEEEYFYGHFARSNPQWEDIVNQKVLAVFQGPHSYISPSWYETNVSVPTWNYVAVHVYGRVEIIENNEELLEDLNEMVSIFEGPNGSYQIDASNSDFVNGLMKGIIGFKLHIQKLEGKWKLSQNHSVERQGRVISNLEQIDNDNAREITKLMRNNID